MPKEKVEVAIFDNDLKCRTIKKYPISDNGEQIRILSGGENHFMPTFDNDSFLELPRRKKYFLFGSIIWRRLYFVKKKGKKCVNFTTGETFGPNPEDSKKAIGSTLLGQIGKEKQDITWISYATLGILVLLLLIQMGVFR